jgi:hypothetical protein
MNKLTEAQKTAIANRMVEEHKKYGDHLRDGHWAEIATRKVLSMLDEFRYSNLPDPDTTPNDDAWAANMRLKSKTALINLIRSEREYCDVQQVRAQRVAKAWKEWIAHPEEQREFDELSQAIRNLTTP